MSHNEPVSIRGCTILIPKNFNSSSVGYFGGIGTGIGTKGIEKGLKRNHFQIHNSSFHDRQKESLFTIAKFEESCHSSLYLIQFEPGI